MKNIFTFNKDEKFVCIVGLLIILLIIGGGMLKSKYVKAEVYVPKDISSEGNTNAMALKKDIFKVEVNSKLDKDASYYVQASTDDLANVKLDLSNVKMSVIGTYKATAILGDTKLPFTIDVVRDTRPIIKITNSNFQFVIEDSSTMSEVIQYAGVSAKDVEGNDISDTVTGWPDHLPTKSSTVTYTLSVKDKNGNTAKQKVQVQYIMRNAQ